MIDTSKLNQENREFVETCERWLSGDWVGFKLRELGVEWTIVRVGFGKRDTWMAKTDASNDVSYFDGESFPAILAERLLRICVSLTSEQADYLPIFAPDKFYFEYVEQDNRHGCSHGRMAIEGPFGSEEEAKGNIPEGYRVEIFRVSANVIEGV